jgi:hypothetical protein
MSLIQCTASPLKRPYSPTRDNPTALTFTNDALAQKRPRLNESSKALEVSCHLESLPTEILQQIFFTALNGNLIRASPRIGLKLSNQAVYRTAFIVAFYHQNLVELRDLYKYLLPQITTQIPYWELRTMVKIVLDSRWCTWDWFKTLYFDLLNDAVARLEQLKSVEISETAMKTISGIRDRSAHWCELASKGLLGKDQDGRMVELDCNPYDIRLTTYRTVSLETDSDDSDANEPLLEDTIHWRLRLFAFGTIPMDASLPRCNQVDGRPFREDFNGVFGLWGSYGMGFPDDLWACLEGRIHSAVQQNDIRKLRKRLQIDYFFHPEDMPYKISPRLFRTAVKNEEWDGPSEPGMSVLAMLFDLDPYSLPCNSSTMKKWAQDAIERICDDRGDRSELYSYFERRQAGESPYSEQAARGFVRQRRAQAYLHKTERDIIRYMRDGVLRDEKNLLSPSFQGPVHDDDVETFMREESQSLKAALPTRQYYRNMTVPELRDELSSRRIKPYSVGRRKDDYIDRLMLEDQRGNRHQWWFDGDCWGDEDLQNLVAFVGDLSYECDCWDDASIGDRGPSGVDDSEDDVDTDDGEDVEEASYLHHSSLDYVPMLVENHGICALLDRKEDYEWFRDV